MVIYSQGAEVSVRKYYAIGGQRVMREDNSNFYLLTDHLGSVVGIADGSGSLVSEQRFLPYGSPRLEPGIDETDFGFTGQRGIIRTELLDYGSRWYLQELGSFAGADTQSGGSTAQQLNRYSYVLSNPVRYSDPSGHSICEDADCKSRVVTLVGPPSPPPAPIDLDAAGRNLKDVFNLFVSLQDEFPQYWNGTLDDLVAFLAYILSREASSPWKADPGNWFGIGGGKAADWFTKAVGTGFFQFVKTHYDRNALTLAGGDLNNALLNYMGRFQSSSGLLGTNKVSLRKLLVGQKGDWHLGFAGIAQHVLVRPDIGWLDADAMYWGNGSMFSFKAANAMQGAADFNYGREGVLYRFEDANPKDSWYILTSSQDSYWHNY